VICAYFAHTTSRCNSPSLIRYKEKREIPTIYPIILGIEKKKACHHDRLFNWKLFKHVDILAKTKKIHR
jgi:hypothetical protein